jgi:hypothetical protein
LSVKTPQKIDFGKYIFFNVDQNLRFSALNPLSKKKKIRRQNRKIYFLKNLKRQKIRKLAFLKKYFVCLKTPQEVDFQKYFFKI